MKPRRLLHFAPLLAGMVLLAGFTAAPGQPGTLPDNSWVNQTGFDCVTMCTECLVGGSVGARREFGPLANDERESTNGACIYGDSCTYGACFASAMALADDLEEALAREDAARVGIIASLNAAHLSAEPERGIFNVLSCDGVTVLATVPAPQSNLAAFVATRSTHALTVN